jgi:hypothetical protein
MLGDIDGANVTIEASARPPEGRSAVELADEVRGDDSSILGVGITVDASPAGNVFDGVIGVAVSGAVCGAQDFPMKSSLGELQRRSMLFTADVLHRLLNGSF